MGVIYEDNFNSGPITDKWKGGFKDGGVISSTFNSGKYGIYRSLEFGSVKDEGDIFFKKTF